MTLDIAESIRAIVLKLLAPTEYHALYAYSVQEQIGDRLSVRPIGAAPRLDDGLALNKIHGLAGASEVCAVGSTVLVAFPGGDPANPNVLGFLSSTPVSVQIDASTEIRLGGAGAVPLAKGGTVDSNIGLLVAAINTIAPGTFPSALPFSVTTKVKGE